MELANCLSIPILSPFVRFAISQHRVGMMERCREDVGLLQPAWLSTPVLRPQSPVWWRSKVYNNYLSIWVSGGTATWQGTRIFLFQQGLRCLVANGGFFCCCVVDGQHTAGLRSEILKKKKLCESVSTCLWAFSIAWLVLIEECWVLLPKIMAGDIFSFMYANNMITRSNQQCGFPIAKF